MTANEFRRAAVALPGVEEKSHMGHPDFRVGGRIFATLGYPDKRFGTLMLLPQDQAALVERAPDVFAPAAGAWGRAGATTVLLRLVSRRDVVAALESAWGHRAGGPVTGGAKTRRAKRRASGRCP